MKHGHDTDMLDRASNMYLHNYLLYPLLHIHMDLRDPPNRTPINMLDPTHDTWIVGSHSIYVAAR